LRLLIDRSHCRQTSYKCWHKREYELSLGKI
jgi:hypothetical protein